MMRPRMKSGLALSLAFLLVYATTVVHAADDNAYMPRSTSTPSAEAMLVDGAFLRPLGVVATLLGTVAFVLTLPFSLPTRSVDKAAQRLVVEPAKYTFVRPFGQIETERPPHQ